MEKTQPLLERLVSDPTMQAVSRSWPSTEGHKNLLLHTDPDYGFVVNAVVRTPHRKGSVHDHSQAWVLYGLLDGTESLERYDRLDDGSKSGQADVTLTGVTVGGPGKVDLVPPFALHAEQGGPGRSVAVILRSEVLVGRILQHGYDPATGTVIERSGPTQIPFEVLADGAA
jgi:predicted metal-dependent enzyme (double-stranded beta helix superfamily)